MVGTVVLTEVAVLGHFSLKLWLAWQISVHCQATVIYDRTRRDIHSKDKERKRETGKDGDFILDTNMQRKWARCAAGSLIRRPAPGPPTQWQQEQEQSMPPAHVASR